MQNVGINALECHVDYKLLEMLLDNNIETIDDLIERAEWLESLPNIGPMRAKAIRQGLINWYVKEARKKYPGEPLVVDALNLKWRWKAELHKYGIITMDQARFVSESQHINIKDTLYPARIAARNAIIYGRHRELRAVAN